MKKYLDLIGRYGSATYAFRTMRNSCIALASGFEIGYLLDNGSKNDVGLLMGMGMAGAGLISEGARYYNSKKAYFFRDCFLDTIERLRNHDLANHPRGNELVEGLRGLERLLKNESFD